MTFRVQSTVKNSLVGPVGVKRGRINYYVSKLKILVYSTNKKMKITVSGSNSSRTKQKKTQKFRSSSVLILVLEMIPSMFGLNFIPETLVFFTSCKTHLCLLQNFSQYPLPLRSTKNVGRTGLNSSIMDLYALPV